jgi:epoxyqueuosine reductase
MTKSNRSHHGDRPAEDRGREDFVKNAARDLGFSLVGIADLSTSARSDRAFDRWIRDGRHAEMRYLSGGADKRHDPGLLLDGARSVISVAVDHYSKSKAERNNTAPKDGKGQVAIYAQGRDYHTVLCDMLEDLDLRLKTRFPGMTSRVAVDTQPISERDLAVKAGIAWLGKNTCVISPEYGSWIFLGELITDLDLRPDVPLETLCGTCSACVDACPTGALNEPFLMDANKCISYLTIEKRGDIPRRHRQAMGARMFGCDTCQQVCPFNDAVRESVLFGPSDVNPIIDWPLDDLIAISDEDFKRLTCESAISRCKPAGLRRNARIVAGNITGDPAQD